MTKSGKGCGGERLNKREEIYSGKELAGNDSLKGREGLGRIGWGGGGIRRGQKNGTGKGQHAQPSASS